MDATTPRMLALIEASTAASEAFQTSTTEHNHPKAASDFSTLAFGMSSIDEGAATLGNLDPNDHARVSDPIVRPAKKHTLVDAGSHTNSSSGNSSNHHQTDAADCVENNKSLEVIQNNKHKKNKNKSILDKKVGIGFSESILSRLFEPDRKQKPELWDFVRLVAPGPANKPPFGQYKWRSKDAVAAYCLKCKIAFTYTPGTSKTVSRHLIAYHGLKTNKHRSSRPKSNATVAIAIPTPPQQHKRKSPSQSRGGARIDMGSPAKKVLASKVKKTTTASSTSGGNHPRKRNSLSQEKEKHTGTNASNMEADTISTKVPNRGLIHRDDENCDSVNFGSNPEKRRLAPSQTDQESNKKERRETEVQSGRASRQGAAPKLSRDRSDRRMNALDTDAMTILSDHDDDDFDLDNCDDSFIKGYGRNRKVLTTKAFFRWWIASHQSLDCYGDLNRNSTSILYGGKTNSSSLFVSFCKTLDNSFELPELSEMQSLAESTCERIRSEIKIHASKLFPRDDGTGNSDGGLIQNNNCSSNSGSKTHEFFSASVRRVSVVRMVYGGKTTETADDIGRRDDAETCHGSYTQIAGSGTNHPNGEGNEIGDEDKTGALHDPGELRRMPKGLQIEEMTFYPVRLTFCTPMFRIKSYVIAVIPGESNEKRHEVNGRLDNEKSSDANRKRPYLKAVHTALEYYGFPREYATRVVIRGSSLEIKQGILASTTMDDSTTMNEYLCILDRLDELVANALRTFATLPLEVKEILREDAISNEGTTPTSTQESTPSTFFAVRACETLLRCLPPDDGTQPVQYDSIAKVLDIVTPFRDAIQTLSEDSYSTIGLAIPVLRRVRDILLSERTHLYEEQENPVPEDGRTQKESLESFLLLILETFEKTFVSVLTENPSLMWTVPLDPRLIAMRGLSETEQKLAKTMLIEEVAKLVVVIDRKEKNQKKSAVDGRERLGPRNKPSRYSTLSTMGGIFWGQDSDAAMSCESDSTPSASTERNAEEYAIKNVDSYFNAVHSQRHVKDPLHWWCNNQDQFPELAMLARKWISASAAYGRKNSRDNERTSVISTSISDTESIRRMIFLHDNMDLI